MIISFCVVLIALALPEIFYGSHMTPQLTLKGFNRFFKNDLFDEDMIVKTDSCHLLIQISLKSV